MAQSLVNDRLLQPSTKNPRTGNLSFATVDHKSRRCSTYLTYDVTGFLRKRPAESSSADAVGPATKRESGRSGSMPRGQRSIGWRWRMTPSFTGILAPMPTHRWPRWRDIRLGRPPPTVIDGAQVLYAVSHWSRPGRPRPIVALFMAATKISTVW